MATVTLEGFAELDEMFRKLGDMPFEVTAEKVVAAMKAADAYGKYLLSM